MNIKVLFFLIIVSSLSCAKDAAEEETKTYSYLALGDSYTIGESVEEVERWPNQLVAKMKQGGFMFNPAKIIAQTGWRTDNLEAGIVNEGVTEKYDLVSLMIGVNNFYQGKPLDEYEQGFRDLLEIAISKSKNGKDGVFVLSIPDYGMTPFGGGNKIIAIDVWNSSCRNICEESGVSYFDVTEISRLGIEQPELVAEDGLHPSGTQYSLWVDEIYTNVIEKLN